jgi:nitroreductase/NAD-dependent dihydropyrimidine dehydrogenase PreA subunit
MINEIQQGTCKSCGRCIAVCPNMILEKNPEKKTTFNEAKLIYCIKCGQCMAVCATKSVSVEGLSYGSDIIELPEIKNDYGAFYNFLASRRSVRNFKDTPVPDNIIQKIIDIVSLAPFGSPDDKVEISVLNDRGKIEKALPYMSEFYGKLGEWMENPVVRQMMKSKLSEEKFNTIDHHLMPNIKRGHYSISNGNDNITRNAPALLVFHADLTAGEHTEDSIIYATYAILAAHSLGLGAAIIGLVSPAINKSKELQELLNIPENHECVTSIIIGYPEFKYKFGIKRDRVKVNWL